VVFEDDDIFGDAVNVAARLEGLAEPGGICVSGRVRGDASGKLDLPFEDMGPQKLKNIARPLRVFRVRADRPGEPASVSLPFPALPLPDKPLLAVLPFQNMSSDRQ
jgi:adenylate cyclase